MKIKDEKTGKVTDVRLPKVFKNKWIKALRSGDFKQTSAMLQDEFGYCCLGVACRIEHPKMNLTDFGLISKSAKLPINKLRVPKALIGSDDPKDSDYNKIVDKLTAMNDSGKSFKVIANYIEKHL